MTTALLLDSLFTEHITGATHPESPARVQRIIEKLKADGLDSECLSIPTPAGDEELLLLNHDSKYIERAKAAVDSGAATLDSPDVEISPQSFDIANRAAEAACRAIDLIGSGKARNAFLATRPPGHHAEFDRAMGFCLFNNVAIAARYALAQNSAKRVCILDWDVHHGNGTQHSFYDSPDVFYISTHTNPAIYYPGTGFAEEIGKGAGEGSTLNIPLDPGTPERRFIEIYETEVIKQLETCKPDLLIISAGFDAHQHDPLGNQSISTKGFRIVSDTILQAASSICDGKVLSVLEGGYNLDALARSVATHLESLVENNS